MEPAAAGINSEMEVTLDMNQQKVVEAAKKHFAKHFAKQETKIVRTESDRHPKGGHPIHLFIAVRLDVANSEPVELIMDDEGHVVELGINERKCLFIPHVE